MSTTRRAGAARWSRSEFLTRTAAADADGLRKVLWNLYWRGPAALRARIEDELSPGQKERRKERRREEQRVDPDELLAEVSELCDLAREGAYLGGSRAVSPKQRSQWRLTFRRLIDEAARLIAQGPSEEGCQAMESLLDLALEAMRLDYFRTQDPLAAMNLVVSDQVHLLWTARRTQGPFPVFAQRAMAQMVRWESPHGWTREGLGAVVGREVALATVLSGLMVGGEAWPAVAGAYLAALTEAGREGSRRPRDEWSRKFERSERASRLHDWHMVLLDRLFGTEAEGLLDRLVRHTALSGAHIQIVEAHLAHRRGDVARARTLTTACLEELPGHKDIFRFAVKIGAPVPPRASELAKERRY